MSRLNSKLKVVAGILGICLLLAVMVAEWRFGAIRVAPRIDRAQYVENANLVILVQPDRAPGFVRSLAGELTRYSIPGWVMNRAMPYEFAMAFRDNVDEERVEIASYASLRRFGQAVFNLNGSESLANFEDRIAWEPGGLTSPDRGVLIADGSITMDSGAADQVFLQWGESEPLVEKSLRGDHLFEVLYDNRAGRAYLSMASMMTAFDFAFTDENMDIMLSSIQFVTMLRVFADVSEDDVLSISIDMGIVPTARNRVGVVNLRGAIDEGFSELGKRLEEEQGIHVEGSSDWNDMTVEFRYTIDRATPFVAQFLQDRDSEAN